jgi:hypothetical protein
MKQASYDRRSFGAFMPVSERGSGFGDQELGLAIRG